MTSENILLARNTRNAPINPNYSQTVAFSHYNNLSAQLPIDSISGNLVPGDINAQTTQCFNNIESILSSIDHSMNDIVPIALFVTDINNAEAAMVISQSFFNAYQPTKTLVAVSNLPMNAMIQVEALVSNGEGTIPNQPQAGDLVKVVRDTEQAPQQSFSSQTVAFSHYNNISAQLPIDSKTGYLVVGGIDTQTKQCLTNIKTILESIDIPFDDIVKLTIFLKHLSDSDKVDAVFSTFFPDSAIARTVSYVPLRTITTVKDLPMNALVQIEAVVSHGDGTPPQKIEDGHALIIEANNTDNAPICRFSTQSVAFSHYNNMAPILEMRTSCSL